MKIPKNATPGDCMEELLPLCREISRLVMTAPIGPEGRQYLALNVLGHFAGTAMGAIQKHQPHTADLPDHLMMEEVSRRLVDVMKGQLP